MTVAPAATTHEGDPTTKPGPPELLELQEVDIPSPADNEVLVRVEAASVNAVEWRTFTLPRIVLLVVGLLTGLRRKKDTRIGADVAGRVEAVGPGVTAFRPGDEVFGIRRGSFAEYACGPQERLALKPVNVSFEAAAAVPLAAMTALQAIRDAGHVRAGHHVLINGAGGGVGTYAVQIAKAYGATVTAVCSTRRRASCPHHHADGENDGGRSRDRARARRRRLRHQAVQPPRAHRARTRGAQAQHSER
jgi:NADPH:quinone reductase-like Zn-dependent oxidoreductase